MQPRFMFQSIERIWYGNVLAHSRCSVSNCWINLVLEKMSQWLLASIASSIKRDCTIHPSPAFEQGFKTITLVKSKVFSQPRQVFTMVLLHTVKKKERNDEAPWITGWETLASLMQECRLASRFLKEKRRTLPLHALGWRHPKSMV